MSNKKNKHPETTAVDSTAAPSPTWIDFPVDITANILHRLGMREILETAERVCTTWRKVCQDPAMWRVIEMKDGYRATHRLKKLRRHAVDRSQGQLIDVALDYHYGDDEFLYYIAQRSSKLKRLTLACCYDLSYEGLNRALRRIPQLEELHILAMPSFSLSARQLEALRASCRGLKITWSNTYASISPNYRKTKPNEALEKLGNGKEPLPFYC